MRRRDFLYATASAALWVVRQRAVRLLGFLSSAPVLHAQEHFGSFQGDLVVKALPGGRDLQLMRSFSYIDPAGKLWAVPAGTVVDGASIPQVFWSIIGGPFEGKYREASVIHDYYCEQKSDTWQNVHLVFYNGMRARGVGSLRAKVMYAAVYNFGPRWIEATSRGPRKLISGHPILLDTVKDAIIRFVSENDPSVSSIQAMSAQLTQFESVDQLEKVLAEHASCTPILANTTANTQGATVRQTLILCGLSAASKKQAALSNLRILTAQLEELVRTQRAFLLPVIENYLEAPDQAKWEEVKQWSRNIYGLVKIGIHSVLDLEDAHLQSMAPSLDDVFGVLSKRAAMISPILSGPPMPKDEMLHWLTEYRMLVQRLEAELTDLESDLVQTED